MIIIKRIIIFLIILLFFVFLFAVSVRKIRQDRKPYVDKETSLPIEIMEKVSFNVGLKIIDFDYQNKVNGKNETITVAVWYPTDEQEMPYVYQAEEAFKSKLALNAPLTKKEAPYPLVLFSHGGYGSGYNAAYFMEYLARHGYIAAAPDYTDTKPPRYEQPIAFSRIKGNNSTTNQLVVLKAVGKFIKDVNTDRNFLFSYLEKYRLDQTSFVIEQVLSLNNDANSTFYKSVDTQAIAIAGHSLGGITALAKTGAYPNKQFKEQRFKAALVFSAPAYPFENTISQLDVPMMTMAGDNDEPGLGPDIPRRVMYDKSPTPKFYLILKNATHLTFGNRGCGRTPLYQAVETVPHTSAISRYGLAFFDKYLKGQSSAGEMLNKKDSAWVYYIKEEKPGEVREWGKEPPPGKGGPGGIRREIGL